MNSAAYDVIVIGGGLHGLSAAVNIARQGASVVVLESSWVGRHASGASAAGVRTLARDPLELPLSLLADAMWHTITDVIGDDCGFHAVGQMKIAEDEAGLQSLEGRVSMLKSRGFNHEELISAEEARALAPGINHKCVGAVIVRTDGAADPHRTLKAYRRAAEKLGVAVLENCPVSKIDRMGANWQIESGDNRFEAPIIVNAAGAWSGRIAEMVGEYIPLGTKASMMLVTERVAPHSFPVISAVGRPLSFKQTDSGTLLIGGGSQGKMDLDREVASVDFLSLSRTVRAATELFEWTGDIRIIRTWAGLEARTADYLPVICKSSVAEGFIHAFGFSGHGFQLVPIVGEVVADLALKGESRHPISPFTAERLAIRSNAA